MEDFNGRVKTGFVRKDGSQLGTQGMRGGTTSLMCVEFFSSCNAADVPWLQTCEYQFVNILFCC
jgi:hypothetical protein